MKRRTLRKPAPRVRYMGLYLAGALIATAAVIMILYAATGA